MNAQKLLSKSSILVAVAVVALLGLAVLPCAAGQPKAAPPGGAIAGATLAGSNPALAAILDKLPRDQGMYIGPDWNDAGPAFKTILAGGKANIQALVGMLIDNTKHQPGQMEDYKVRWALHGCVVLAAKQGEKERQMVAETLASSLNANQGKFVEAFILQEILWCGSTEQIPVLAKYLGDDMLYDYALRALEAIGPESEPAIRTALATAKGRPRLALIQTLGTLRDSKSVADITKFAADTDRDTRVAALDALGNIGDPSAVTTLLGAVEKAQEPWEHVKACEDSLLLAKRLMEVGDSANAVKIYQALSTSTATANDKHVQIAAIQGVALAKADVASLTAALKSEDFQVRESVLQAIATTPGPAATKVVCDILAASTTAADRANFLGVLATRKDPTAVPAILVQLKDQDDQVRTAAANALAAIGGQQATTALLTLLNSTNAKDQQTASSALRNLQGKEGDAAIAVAAAKVQDAGVRANLITVLGSHRAVDQADTIAAAMSDKDAQVRVAGIKAMGMIATEKELPALVKVLTTSKDGADVGAAEEALKSACGRALADKVAEAVAPAAAQSVAPNAQSIVRVLGTAGGAKSLAAVAALAKAGQGDVKDAAVRVLADWKTTDAAAPLLEVAGTAEGNLKVIALRGATRLAGDKAMTAEEKSKILTGAMKVASRPEEKREILGALGSAPSVAALQAAATCIDDEAVREEACAAVVRIAEQIAKASPTAVQAPLVKVVELTKNNGIRDQAKRILQQTGMKV